MQRLEHAFQIGLVAVFSLFLVVAILFTYQSKDDTYSYFENRLLAPKPEYSEETVLNGSYFSGLEEYLSDHVAWRTACAQLDARIDCSVGRPVINDVVIQKDILLPWLAYESVSEQDIANAAAKMSDNLQSVNNLVSSYGGEYYYVAVPCQYAYHADKYPSYMNNRSELTQLSIKYLRHALQEKDVEFIDMGVIFDSLGHPDGISSKVDNHFSIHGAYETYLTIMDHINCGDTELAVLGEDDFSYFELEIPYLGSRMRKLLNIWQSDERLSIIQLNSPIEFTRTDNGNVTASTVYAFPASSDEWVTYNLYMGGDIGNTVIDTERDKLPSILIYGDSFTNAVECILYWSFNEMHSLDLRYYNGELSFKEYIEAYRPDYVICIRDYEALLLQTGNGTGVN